MSAFWTQIQRVLAYLSGQPIGSCTQATYTRPLGAEPSTGRRLGRIGVIGVDVEMVGWTHLGLFWESRGSAMSRTVAEAALAAFGHSWNITSFTHPMRS